MNSLLVIFRIFIFIGTATSILWLSLDPDPPVPSWEVLSWDKLQHALAYAVLTLTAGGLVQVFKRPLWVTWAAAFTLSLGFGVIVEILQKYLTSNRRFETLDILADGIGALLTATFAFWWKRSRAYSRGSDQ
ncbi:VanZ family protein [Desulfuromonas sp. AOP6]|uniref:VanZ family protein n=1 Tax=Desulfuromonas sp. AOP6 TaxID=1566351 RepID=UPI001289E678|nr:VanZ family protein [Desulfuromonas sp. AOP6]BCA79781.1 hypothetical protein AOP6_1568 [Desulfuromonas sp. AOP6]